MRKLEKDEEVDYDKKARFAVPPGDLGIVVNCDEYKYDGIRPADPDNPLDIEENENFGDDLFGDEEDEVQDTLRRKQLAEENEEFGEDF